MSVLTHDVIGAGKRGVRAWENIPECTIPCTVFLLASTLFCGLLVPLLAGVDIEMSEARRDCDCEGDMGGSGGKVIVLVAACPVVGRLPVPVFVSILATAGFSNDTDRDVNGPCPCAGTGDCTGTGAAAEDAAVSGRGWSWSCGGRERDRGRWFKLGRGGDESIASMFVGFSA